jgi:hypothetical protein
MYEFWYSVHAVIIVLYVTSPPETSPSLYQGMCDGEVSASEVGYIITA